MFMWFFVCLCVCVSVGGGHGLLVQSGSADITRLSSVRTTLFLFCWFFFWFAYVASFRRFFLFCFALFLTSSFFLFSCLSVVCMYVCL